MYRGTTLWNSFLHVYISNIHTFIIVQSILGHHIWVTKDNNVYKHNVTCIF